MSTNIQPRILVVDDDPSVCKLIRKRLEQEGYAVTVTHTGEEGYAEALRHPPHLAILEVILPKMDGYTLCRQLRANPSTHATVIVIVTSQVDVADRLKGFEAGADDYVTKPFASEELRYRVKNLLARSQVVTLLASPPAARGRAIAIFGTKGGVGKTTTAVNLAVALHRRSSELVALLDADFYFGDVGVYLDLPPVHSIEDLIGSADQLDWDLVKQVLLRHGSGIHVLLNPIHPEQAERITPQLVKHLLEILTQQHAYVVVDCQPTYDERMLAILDFADEILLVVTPEIGPLKNTRQFLEMSGKLGLAPEKIHLVFNRADSDVGIQGNEIERALRHKVACRINSGGRLLVRSANRGVPFIVEQPTHPVSQQFFQMADYLISLSPRE